MLTRDEHERLTHEARPPVRKKDLMIVVVLFLSAVGLYSLDWFNGFRGGVSTVGAERVLAGEIPYRDFWTMYAPGQFYLLALLYRIFGTHLLVELVSAAIVCAAAACVCYQLALKLGGRRIAALACAGIFLAALYNTGYFKNLGSYPPAMLFVFLSLNFMALHYRAGQLSYLALAGLATGATILFKHDVGGYTAIAIIAGLMIHHLLLLKREAMEKMRSSLLLKLGVYFAGTAVIVLPFLFYFAALAGPDMLQDLIVFSLTDFRYSRPEGYPSLLPFGIYDASRPKMLVNLLYYLSFAVPFLLFLLGVLATALMVRKRMPEYAALGVTFSLAYLLHYSAAHVQINTHIISLSIYGALLGLIFLASIGRKRSLRSTTFTGLCVLTVVAVWFFSLAAQPAYSLWTRQRVPTAELKLEKVSGVKVAPDEARHLEELSAFVDAHTPPDQKIFIGLHRHDVVVIGDVMLYFILNRPSATRYQELHPAITDTAHIQREIIHDLQNENISLIVLKHIFSDQTLERVKKDFLKNLPHIGAMELDDFIRENYFEARQFGPYEVWQRKDKVSWIKDTNRTRDCRGERTSPCPDRRSGRSHQCRLSHLVRWAGTSRCPYDGCPKYCVVRFIG